MVQTIAPARPVSMSASPTNKATTWVRQGEHATVRLGSLALSVVSGDSIYWFFSFMNGIDRLQPVMTVITAVAIGLLGYVILRALTHRLLHKEKIWVYIPLCFTLVAVETVANFMKAIVGVYNDHWLAFVPHPLLGFMTVATYVVLSIMPAFTVFLAYVDMDLERAKHSPAGASSSAASSVSASGKAPATPVAAPVAPMMPKTPSPSQYPTQTFGTAPAPVFTAGMNNMPRYAPAMAPVTPTGYNGQGQGQGYGSFYQRP